jgi:hypothetical protein
MTLVSHDCWSSLILWILFDHGALDMALGGCSHDDTQDVVHYTQDVAYLMQRVGPYDD